MKSRRSNTFLLLTVAIAALAMLFGSSRARDACWLERGAENFTGEFREAHTAVWTGSEVIIWGGYRKGDELNTGWRHNPVTGVRTAIPEADAPEARKGHAAVWTSSEIIVWGGEQFPWTGEVAPDGARYRPRAALWTPITADGPPAALPEQSAVWTGNEMLVFGGLPGGRPLYQAVGW